MNLRKNSTTNKNIIKMNKQQDGEKNIPIDDDLIVSLSDVGKTFITDSNKFDVLANVNLEIKKGEFVVILGPSGSGKTTLMNIISGLERATTGIVNVLGHNLINLGNTELTTFRRENIGYIFQQYGLLPNLNVKDNIMLGDFLYKKNISFFHKKYKKSLKSIPKINEDKINSLEKKYQQEKDVNLSNNENLILNYKTLIEIEKLKNKPDTTKDSLYKEYLYNINSKNHLDQEYFKPDNIMKILQIDSLAKKFPSELSGGQQQRVSIARTLSKNPKILFADEPTGAVDIEMSKIIMTSLQNINKEYGTTIVIVTHNPIIAEMADTIIYFNSGNISNIIKNGDNKKNCEEMEWK